MKKLAALALSVIVLSGCTANNNNDNDLNIEEEIYTLQAIVDDLNDKKEVLIYDLSEIDANNNAVSQSIEDALSGLSDIDFDTGIDMSDIDFNLSDASDYVNQNVQNLESVNETMYELDQRIAELQEAIDELKTKLDN
ncbi:hypothetical protein [Paenibacillus gallinarum]|uniref:Lipoprotein n=1 Tax=Paenibacillus gallinarum TaxID=2762232 RepID=A0ABR8T1E8_9BACL|nr:hypothetical protein [Paenibacillus gallinarum]MBD7969579.1 hypothetical protein [Paenibacillus gallinarum]